MLGDNGQDVGDVEFKVVGGGEFRWVSLTGFTKLGEAGMDRGRVVCRIGMLGPKVFLAEAYRQRRQH